MISFLKSLKQSQKSWECLLWRASVRIESRSQKHWWGQQRSSHTFFVTAECQRRAFLSSCPGAGAVWGEGEPAGSGDPGLDERDQWAAPLHPGAPQQPGAAAAADPQLVPGPRRPLQRYGCIHRVWVKPYIVSTGRFPLSKKQTMSTQSVTRSEKWLFY